MSKEITMPRLSETMPHGKILVWYKKPNDRVEKGDVIAEVETDKANMEIEAVDSGTLAEILVSEGQEAKVGEPIAILDGKKAATAKEEKQPEEAKAEKPTPPEKPAPESLEKAEIPQEEKVPEKYPEKTPEKIPEKHAGGKASLLIRELSEQMNVDLSKISGTGPGGQIKRSDILKATERNGKQEIPKEELQLGDTVAGEKLPLSNIRETIARRMAHSKQTSPHFYTTVEVDADALVDYYGIKREVIEGITYNDIFIKAAAHVLKDYPHLNASFKGDHISIKTEINIGFGIESEKGLLVPVVHNVDHQSLQEIRERTKQIKERVKEEKLKPEDMTGGTFTISNLGMYGVQSFIAILNPPQSAGLAVASIMKKPVVKDDEIKVGHTFNITLSGDHRVFDGAEGARFVKDLKNILENPERIEKL